ncbi:MAG: PolC-type DNA polymerase III [Christensenellales bacterium]
MAKAKYIAALKNKIGVDERYGLELDKVQHDVKKDCILMYFRSGLLPAELYLSVEKYVKETAGENARIIIKYKDINEDGALFAEHIRSLCCYVKEAAAPFLERCLIRVEGHTVHIDFADDIGAEVFSALGLKDYINDYLSRCLGGKASVLTGRCEPDMLPPPVRAIRRKKKNNTELIITPKPARESETKPARQKQNTIHGKPIAKGQAVSIKDISELTGECIVCGQVTEVKSFDIKKATRGERSIIVFGVTDYTSTVTCKAFVSREKCDAIKQRLNDAPAVRVAGNAAYDSFSKEICVSVKSIEQAAAQSRIDDAPVKRVELHMHTNMSALDACADEADVVKRAVSFGHDAVAITDHGVVQAFPRAFDEAKKHGIKVIYGMEAYMLDDTKEKYSESFEDEYVVFDIETTGLNPNSCGITEIGAVRLIKGEITDTFSTFVNPGMPISPQITDLTGITDEMVKDAPRVDEALRMFKEFAGDKPLAAHNASFDLSFIEKYGEDSGISFENERLDTLWLIKRMFPDHKSYSLGKLAADFGISFKHHRALNDAECTAKLMIKCFEQARTAKLSQAADEKTMPVYHTILLCENKTGLYNLYKLVTESHLNHFYRRPRVPKSLLSAHREGLIVGSACEKGELVSAILRYASDGELEHIARFYDYLEVQPDANNYFLVRDGRFRTKEGVRDITRRVVALGEAVGKPVAATCDAHFIEPQHEYFRRILMHGQKFADADSQPPLFFRTTPEMLAEFSYLGEKKAYEIVVQNTRDIAARAERIELLPDEPAMPKIKDAAEKLEKAACARVKQVYGDPVPEVVLKRLEYELSSIIKHGYGVLYYIASKLVRHSLENGYLVGSRGSVGSSFAATMAGITEVNPLPPHYVCPKCKNSEFDIDTGVYSCGPDLPEKDCPVCKTAYIRDGYDIPFAVFLGINADKVPDIDLNFSGIYQQQAHNFILDFFGNDHVFRAGTISSIKSQTAYGFVKAYLTEKNINASKAEVERLVKGVTGTKRTTGQHPGGLVILPEDRDIHEFTPLQYPANDPKSGSVTTHFNFGSLHDRLIKLDILGHDDPTALRMLFEITGIDPKEVPLCDKDTLSLFSSTATIGIEPAQIGGCEVGSLGIPEFGTKFVRQILTETRPTTIGELIRICGLSHGTDVWLNNARDLIKNGTATLREVICTRDDIMNYLVTRGIDETEAFYIMESVRRGKGLKEEWEKSMAAAGVPAWFAESCKKIAYMFPRAHAVAYVIMALRIAYFKVHYPRAFYATYFSVRADSLDAAYLQSGETVRGRIAGIQAKGKDASALEQSQLTVFEVALEMIERGIDFLPPDLYLSDAMKCVIERDGIRLPFTAMSGTGETAARGIERAREQGEFISVEDLKSRSGVSSAVITAMEELGCLSGLLKSSQLSLFDLGAD